MCIVAVRVIVSSIAVLYKHTKLYSRAMNIQNGFSCFLHIDMKNDLLVQIGDIQQIKECSSSDSDYETTKCELAAGVYLPCKDTLLRVPDRQLVQHGPPEGCRSRHMKDVGRGA
jgi:hypothetical protein